MSPAMTAAERLLAWHHSQLVERASQPHYNVSWLPPAAPAVSGLSGASTVAHPRPCRPGGWQGEHALALGKAQAGISLHLVICSTAVV